MIEAGEREIEYLLAQEFNGPIWMRPAYSRARRFLAEQLWFAKFAERAQGDEVFQ